ncbi:MAG TPA: homoserine dehydrogenase [Chloroflexota bacterium]|nr:homoserine dehydrogenase [Chloroflexota bacterium]
MTTYRTILMGFGNVGRAVANLWLQRGAQIEREHDISLRFVMVADRSGAALDPGGLDLPRLLEVKAATGAVAAYPGAELGLGGAEAISHIEADLLLEASPTSVRTGEPGLSHIRAAMSHGMHVVNANKGPLVVAYHDLMRLARAENVAFLNSATVAAPIPALDIARYSLHGAQVESIEAVPNGTTNYILTLMEEGRSLDDGIRAAQQAGIAETDPSLDVDGWDSAAKIIILANTLMGGSVRLDDVSVQGIRSVGADELRDLRRRGQALKLLATVRRDGDELSLSVAPARLPLDHPLAILRGSGMGILFHTDLLGDLCVTVTGDDSPFGTAQAMLRDVVNIGR